MLSFGREINGYVPLRHNRSPVRSPLEASSTSVSSTNEGFRIPPWLPTFGTAATGGLLFGYDIGSSSSVVRILGSGTTEFGKLDPLVLGQIASFSLLGAMTASALLIVLGDEKIGRKTELITASLLFAAGTAVQTFSLSLSLVLGGRVLYGLGIGTAMHAAPLYIAETSPNELRGKLVSLKEAAIVVGIVLGYGAGAVFGDAGDWRAVFECGLPIELLMLLGAVYVPESPRWLSLRGRPEEAVQALKTAQGLSESEAKAQVQQMTQMSLSLSPSPRASEEKEREKENVIAKFQEIFQSPYNRQALIIGVGLVLLQQLSGQPSVLYFANRIFENAGLGFEAALGVGIFKLIMTLVSASLVDNENW
eukprot:CAMPEP_0182437210 /NCGR_PEP_ID=MMETSP1167-20130531/84888_1 /TAXON_ID=2988 /ORGANISM="Mallomonas Sp, Strain CCMP3275" /LENGTH=363 /DNA_ID=CAMNT_0024630039 /DNA_START=142 /DNA_END=1230 /DNA_ORIENTATION=-